MIHQFILTFAPAQGNAALVASDVHMSSLHAWLFREVLPQYSPAEATWLHDHPAPKPFALAPLFGAAGELSGLRLTVWAERTAEALAAAWQGAMTGEKIYQLGRQAFVVGEVTRAEPVDFAHLLEKASARNRLRLRFQTPCAFKQTTAMQLFLPLPGNVFERPYQVWQAYAPASWQLPESWPNWCAQKVMVQQHAIRTQMISLNHRANFIGFTGFVEFVAKKTDEQELLRIWQALGRLASYCGVGYKTTMGMGAVAYLPGRRKKPPSC